MSGRRRILHADMNNFYASVECLYHPEIRRYPVAVCGDPVSRRGIVLAKNLLAKRLGIKTGWPIWQAKQLAPDLVTVPPDFKKYLRFSRLARSIYADYTDQIEPFGIDECWLDVTATPIRPELLADTLRQRIKAELGVTVSVGVSFNKIFAKLGSDLKKPDATTLIPYESYQQIVWPLPIRDLLYVGRATERKLQGLGIETIGELALTDPQILQRRLGKWGQVLRLFARGQDTDPVRRLGEGIQIKSIGNGTTCPRDLENDGEVRLVLTVLAESVAARLRECGLECSGVQVYVCDKELFSLTRQQKLAQPSCLSGELLRTGMELFGKCHQWPVPVRGLGLRGYDLVTAGKHIQLSLFDHRAEDRLRQVRLAQTVDGLRERFGRDALVRASALLDKKLTGFDPKEDHVIHPLSYFR